MNSYYDAAPNALNHNDCQDNRTESIYKANDEMNFAELFKEDVLLA